LMAIRIVSMEMAMALLVKVWISAIAIVHL
jgi:hypothetical protein